ncbi:hypothetical protein D3C87_887190 [compost metagenome]
MRRRHRGAGVGRIGPVEHRAHDVGTRGGHAPVLGDAALVEGAVLLVARFCLIGPRHRQPMPLHVGPEIRQRPARRRIGLPLVVGGEHLDDPFLAIGLGLRGVDRGVDPGRPAQVLQVVGGDRILCAEIPIARIAPAVVDDPHARVAHALVEVAEVLGRGEGVAVRTQPGTRLQRVGRIGVAHEHVGIECHAVHVVLDVLPVPAGAHGAGHVGAVETVAHVFAVEHGPIRRELAVRPVGRRRHQRREARERQLARVAHVEARVDHAQLHALAGEARRVGVLGLHRPEPPVGQELLRAPAGRVADHAGVARIGLCAGRGGQHRTQHAHGGAGHGPALELR